MTRQRPISPFESVYFLDLGAAGLPLYDMPAFVESLVRGRPDPALIRRALVLLTERHPILRAEVAAGEGACCCESATGSSRRSPCSTASRTPTPN